MRKYLLAGAAIFALGGVAHAQVGVNGAPPAVSVTTFGAYDYSTTHPASTQYADKVGAYGLTVYAKTGSYTGNNFDCGSILKYSGSAPAYVTPGQPAGCRVVLINAGTAALTVTTTGSGITSNNGQGFLPIPIGGVGLIYADTATDISLVVIAPTAPAAAATSTPTTTVTASLTLTGASGDIDGNAASAAIVATLPACTASNKYELHTLKKIDSSVNAVSFTAAGSDLIDGAASVAITTQYASASVKCSDVAGRWDRGVAP